MASIGGTNAVGRGLLLALAGALAVVPRAGVAATLSWKGHSWQVTSGGMAGVCQGSPNNVTIDASGYLHFKISNSGGTWTPSQMVKTDKAGFGTEPGEGERPPQTDHQKNRRR